VSMKTKWTKRLLGGALVGAVSLFLGLQAHAAGYTPAGTEIRNQSVATYKDANNQPQISTSNEVINIVKELYGLEITPDHGNGTPTLEPFHADVFDGTDTKPALKQTTAPGNVAYYHYYLKNTGNAPDTYTLEARFAGASGTTIQPDMVEVYYDANGNGQVDAGDTLLYWRKANGDVMPSPPRDEDRPAGRRHPLDRGRACADQRDGYLRYQDRY